MSVTTKPRYYKGFPDLDQENTDYADLVVMPTRAGISVRRKESGRDQVGITTARRGRLDCGPRELHVGAHRHNPRCRAGLPLLFLAEPVKEAQPEPPDYADPLTRIPFTSQAIQHQGRHNDEVGIVVARAT